MEVVLVVIEEVLVAVGVVGMMVVVVVVGLRQVVCDGLSWREARDGVMLALKRLPLELGRLQLARPPENGLYAQIEG